MSQIAYEDLTMLKETVQSFMKHEVLPAELEGGLYQTAVSAEIVQRLQEKGRAVGLWAYGAKKEWGGSGLSIYDRVVLAEATSGHRFGLFQPALDAFGKDVPSYLEKCTQAQLETYVLPAISSGTGIFQALYGEGGRTIYEPTVIAKKVGDDWSITGKKAFVFGVQEAEVGVLLAHCEDADGVLLPTLFFVEKEDGFERKQVRLIDVKDSETLTFESVIIPDSRRIGEVGAGEELVRKDQFIEQILLSARLIGIGKRALDYANQYAGFRETRGQLLIDFPTIRMMITTSLVQLEASYLLVLEAAKKLEEGANDRERYVYMAKQLAGDVSFQAVDTSLQIHGGSGFAGDLPIERWYKEVKLARNYGLTSEECIMNVAEEIYRS